jgi:sugar lactone lactonase YvrE
MANTKNFVTKGPVEIEKTASLTAGTVSTGASEGYYLGGASYTSKSKDVTSQTNLPTGLALSSDGTKMYVISSNGNNCWQYSLSTAWDVSTATYAFKSFNFGTEIVTSRGITFKPDGTKMYISESYSSVDSIFAFDLSTAWDVSTAAYNNETKSVAAQDSEPLGVEFNADGTKLYVIGATNDSVFQYSLSTAYDVSTSTYDSVSFDVSSQTSAPNSIRFNADGTKMYVGAFAPDEIYQYSLSPAYDISTASYDNVSFNFSAQEGTMYGFDWGDNGTKFYLVGTSTDTVYQYSAELATVELDLSTGDIFNPVGGINYDVKLLLKNGSPGQTFTVEYFQSGDAYSLASVEPTYNNSQIEYMPESNYPPIDFAIVPSGATSKLYWYDDRFYYVSEGTFGTRYDLTTVPSNYETRVDVDPYQGNGRAMFFEPSTRVYVADSSGVIAQFSLSGGDLSTASYVASYSSGLGVSYGSLWFKPDGTKAYFMNGGIIRQLSLSTAWAISTASLTASMTISGTLGSDSFGLFFNDTGTRAFVGAGANNGTIYQFSLSTAWDITSISYSGTSYDVNPYSGKVGATNNTNWSMRSLYPIDNGKFFVLLVAEPFAGFSNTAYNRRLYKYTFSDPYTVLFDDAVKWQGGTPPESANAGDLVSVSFVTVEESDGSISYYGNRSGLGGV